MLITESDLAQVDRDGEITFLKEGPIAICRCGQTDKSPFCSGAHKGCGFEAEGVVLRDTRKNDPA